MRQPAIKLTEPDHYEFIKSIGLDAMTGIRSDTLDADHFSYNDARLGKVAAGMGQKTHFGWCLPISHDAHMRRHGQDGIDTFLGRHGMKKHGEGIDLILGPGVMAMTLLGFSAMNNVTGARSFIADHAWARAWRARR